MNNLTIRKAEPHDVPSMYKLIKELAVYEKAPEAVITSEASMLRDGFGEDKVYEGLVAVIDNTVVGVAIYYIAYSTWNGRIIYLDDFVVSEAYRRSGIGKLLFDEVGKISKDLGVNQFRWHVLDWNRPAINFYKKYSAVFDDGWITCKLGKDQIDKLF